MGLAAISLAVLGGGVWMARGWINAAWLIHKLPIVDEQAAIPLIERLGELRSARAVPAMLERFAFDFSGDKPPSCIEACATAIRKIGPPAIPYLAWFLREPNQIIKDRFQLKHARELALVMLGSFGPDARNELSLVLAMVRDPDCEERGEAIMAAGSLGPGNVVTPVLLQILGEDLNEYQLSTAASVLAMFGSESRAALPTLKKKLEGIPEYEDGFRAAISDAIAKIESK